MFNCTVPPLDAINQSYILLAQVRGFFSCGHQLLAAILYLLVQSIDCVPYIWEIAEVGHAYDLVSLFERTVFLTSKETIERFDMDFRFVARF